MYISSALSCYVQTHHKDVSSAHTQPDLPTSFRLLLSNFLKPLAGNKITVIENLAATENQFDSIDLSDNSIVKLEGFPRLLRLKQLLLCNNRITRVGPYLENQLPNLETLILTNNRIERLQDLDLLGSLKKLQVLSLVENPVTKQRGYRLYVISRCKGLKVLDFKKVTQTERAEADKAFAGKAAPAHEEIKGSAPAAAEEATTTGAAATEPAKKAPTAAQLAAIRAAIAQAQTMEEVQELEAALRSGQVPSRLQPPQAQGGAEGEAMED